MREQEHLARCDSQSFLGKTSLVWQPSYLSRREFVLAVEGTMQNSPSSPLHLCRACTRGEGMRGEGT